MHGLHDQFSAGTTLLGLHFAMRVTAPLHELNRVLQAMRETVSGMVQCVQTVRSSLSSKRDDDSFKGLIQHVMQKVEQLELQPIQLPESSKTLYWSSCSLLTIND